MSKKKKLPGKNDATNGLVQGSDLSDIQGLKKPDQTAVQVNQDKNGVANLVIEPEVSDMIQIGAGDKLVVPREDIDVDLDGGTEIDLVKLQAKKIRKPGRREWIALHLSFELLARMLLYKSRPDDIETDYYYIDKALRGPINDELKNVRVVPYYSLKLKTFALWIVHVTLENSWYESLAELFKQPAEFFTKNAVRVMSDMDNKRYRVRFKPMASEVVWPTKATGELLGEALGSDHFIRSADHPIYRELIEGVELG
jgi:hypothetical protein